MGGESIGFCIFFHCSEIRKVSFLSILNYYMSTSATTNHFALVNLTWLSVTTQFSRVLEKSCLSEASVTWTSGDNCMWATGFTYIGSLFTRWCRCDLVGQFWWSYLYPFMNYHPKRNRQIWAVRPHHTHQLLESRVHSVKVFTQPLHLTFRLERILQLERIRCSRLLRYTFL